MSQLWDALDSHEADQWLWYLKNIVQTYDRQGDIKQNYTLWPELIAAYQRQAEDEAAAKESGLGHSQQ